MEDQNKNLILAIVLSVAVIIVWSILFPPQQDLPTENIAVTTEEGEIAMPPPAQIEGESEAPTASETAVASAPRIQIETDLLEGSISLAGGRIDDLRLKAYRVSLDPNAQNVTLLSYDDMVALFAWAATDAATGEVPGAYTVWKQVGSDTLSVGKPVTLAWENEAGLKFTRVIEIDDSYMFTVTDRVENTGAAAASLYAFGVVERQGLPEDLRNFFILHEGVVRLADDTLDEIDYGDIEDGERVQSEGNVPADVVDNITSGWIGFTDHYWQAILIPESGQTFTASAKFIPQSEIYRTVTRRPPETLSPGATTEVSTRLFAGPKEWETIRSYQNQPGYIARLLGAKTNPNIEPVPQFIDSIDWGWFSFLTKPMFAVLHWLNAGIGNMGLAIIALTFVLKAVLFPVARKSYISMARMRELQPQMTEIRERNKENPQQMQKDVIALYKREKVNPAAGCLPLLLQIPIFFSLYKVIFVTLELRQAPFIGWIRDLSTPDPSSIYNFFGLLPWAAPVSGTLMATIFIGVLPILLGVSMWFQQKLNPAPPDPTHAAIFAWMPWIFMFMLGSFASGLVIYWITNNVLTFIQQYFIMWRHGNPPELFDNIKSSFRRGGSQK